MLRHIPARHEQTQSLSNIVRDALRAAALAPDTASALDVAGAALCDIAQFARDQQLPSTERADDHPLRTFGCVADDTLGVLERAACIFDSIERLTRDGDETINELALIGRTFVAQQAKELDGATVSFGRYISTTEVCHA
ncbi:hypothetical protein [Paraburkholderia pallida]|uniref:Uncharacterized protein n=1 Tax=Paraburkholderia pallida TaxID=2547399 RepID=A0A4P7CT41_9BURK|nr:hypothetical protein [Paraburkholderia pallida]QBQ97896.1 hypothetical protein E1956_12395 [Paraburkholderia pallida]